MNRFDKIIEEWAIAYKPMQHTLGLNGINQRFFQFDSIVSIPQFAGKLDMNRSPCVGFEFHKEGNIIGGKVKPVYNIYFLVNVGTNNPTAKGLAADAVAEAESHAHKFLAWLMQEQEKRSELRNLDLQNIEYGTFGPLLNNWYALFLQMRDVEVYNLCVDQNDYI